MARLPPSERKTLRQFSLSPEVHKFLDTLKKGDMSAFVENAITSTDEYGLWVVVEAKRLEKAKEAKESA